MNEKYSRQEAEANNRDCPPAARLEALRELKSRVDAGLIAAPPRGTDVNNHIHTTYSFSPYTPSMAAWRAYMAGLCTAGIVDHDSVSGVREFIAAGDILGLPVTVGAELRAHHDGTALGERRTNNPDQSGISYLSLHGIPRQSIDAVAAFLQPIGVARGKRNRQMCASIAALTGISLDYERDVLPLSLEREGGSVTERHLLYALVLKLLSETTGQKLILRMGQFMELSAKEKDILQNTADPWYAYRLLGVLKSRLVEKFYIPAGLDECPNIHDVVRFANESGIILTYPYLGDVADSPTGDKKAQAFEDAYLDTLFAVLAELGFKAISYMPSRNSMAQIMRVRNLCDEYGMLQITGEDINSPFQSFICVAQRGEAFQNLYDTTWALIGHELASQDGLEHGFLRVELPLAEKIERFKRIAQNRW